MTGACGASTTPYTPFLRTSTARSRDADSPKGSYFPEDVGSVFGATGKRPRLKVRSWLTALLKLSLIQSSMSGGVFQHDRGRFVPARFV